MSDYIKEFSSIDFTRKRDGVYIKSITGQNAQLLLIRLDPGSETLHTHPNEQIGYILSGFAELTINNETSKCNPGDAFLIPCDVLHGFRVTGNVPLEYLEIFSPPKKENKT